MKTTIILNPQAGGGRAGRRLSRLRPLLDDAFHEPTILETRTPEDAITLTREALRNQAERIVAMGGDGTISDVLNGFYENGKLINPDAVLAPLSSGTGGDLVRSLRDRQWFPSTITMRVRRVAEGSISRIDVGRVQCAGPDGREHPRYFGNVASIGYTASVIDYVNEAQLPAWLGGTTTFFWSILRTLWSAPPRPVTLQVDGICMEIPDALCVMIANGRYFAGGLAIAPEATLTDGLLDVVAIHGASPGKLVRRAPAFYRGRHTSLDEVTMLRGRHVELSSPVDTRIETDGEIIGALPARIDVLPGAVRVQG